MSLKDKNIVVTGGSRGLGLGLVEALVAHGARVTVVARETDALQSVRARLGVATISADVTDETAAHRVLAEVHPDILVLNAGTTPRMGRFQRAVGDRREGRALLDAGRPPLSARAGRACPLGSSGAARQGSPLSGGYAGAKRMLWFMANYANGVSKQKALGIRFQTIVPDQIIGGTGVGDEASSAYARAMGVERGAFLARFGAPMPPREFGEQVVSVLDDPKYADGFTFGLKGVTGVTMLEGVAT